MQNKPKISYLSVAFQTASAFVAGVVGANPAFGQTAAAHLCILAAQGK